jgi:DNA-directed RNA polymerase specialized sigma24 family protein
MSEPTSESVTTWITCLKDGDPDAAQRLWQRYFEDLVRLARARLRSASRAVADEEDAALSAFDSFCRGAARGRYPRLDDRNDLWQLLVKITEGKAIDQVQLARRKKRGGDKVVGTLDPAFADRHGGATPGVANYRPTPEFAALMADECRHLLGQLRDDSLRAVARLRMEGFTDKEIASRLGCGLRSVARKVELIRRTWLEEGQSES